MVAALLRLRFRVLANTLQRNVVQLVAVIVGGFSTLGLLLAVFGGMLIASGAPPAATEAVVVVGGTVLIIGWLVVPLLFDGVDRTVDAVRLARFPLRPGQLMAAMFLVGVTGIPGIATVIAALGTAVAWRLHPASALAAVASGVVGVAICVVGSRLTTSVAGSLLGGRGAWRVGIAALVLVVLAGPPLAVVVGRISTGGSDLVATLSAVVGVLGWTPLGAVWSVPGRLAIGDSPGAVGAASIAILTLLVLLVLWRSALGAGLRVRGEKPARAVAGGRMGLLGRLPATPAGAIAARSLIYWFRDARLARQLILIPVLPALLLLWWRLLGVDEIAIATGPVVAILLPLSSFAILSYDGTAFAAELAAGVRGRDDRIGRAVALLVIGVPAAVIVQVTAAVIIGRTADLPALLGLSLGVLLISVGVVSVSSARIVVPVPRSARNPFSAQPGAATVSIAASYAVTGVTVALALPVVALAVAALVGGSALYGWLALIGGLLLGGGVAVGGVLLGGRVLDASGPNLLARMRAIRE